MRAHRLVRCTFAEASHIYNNEQNQLPEKRSVRAVPTNRPGAEQRAHYVTPLRSCTALTISSCACTCSDTARYEPAVPP